MMLNAELLASQLPTVAPEASKLKGELTLNVTSGVVMGTLLKVAPVALLTMASGTCQRLPVATWALAAAAAATSNAAAPIRFKLFMLSPNQIVCARNWQFVSAPAGDR